MLDIEEFYDDLAYHKKESANLPFTFSSMSVDQQIFFRDLYDEIMMNTEKRAILIDDLNLMKSDLEAVIASIKK